MVSPLDASLSPTPGRQGYLPAQAGPGDLTDELLNTDFWSDDMVARAGIPVVDVPFVTVGGGIGSFVTVDYLRIAGRADLEQIRVLSNIDHPWQTYEYLTRVSQIPRGRADPVRLVVAAGQHLGLPVVRAERGAGREAHRPPAVHVLVEPIFADYWTPAGRPGVRSTWSARPTASRYPDMLVKGVVRMVRRRAGRRLLHASSPRPSGTSPTKRIAFRSRFVHLAVGYPGLRFLPDLQALSHEHSDYHARGQRLRAARARLRVPHAPAPAPSWCAAAASSPPGCCSGSWTTGSCTAPQTTIVHLFRTFVDGPNDGPATRGRR